MDVGAPKKRRTGKRSAATVGIKEQSPVPGFDKPPPSLSEPSASAQGATESLPDYEHHHHERRHKGEWLKVHLTDIRFLIVVGLLLVFLVGWLAGVPAYRHIKSLRAIKLMEQSQSMADAGHIPKALDLMRQAITMAPTNEAVFRMVRLLNAGIGDVQALAFLQHKMMNGEADPDELIVLAEQSLRSGQEGIAKLALEKLEGNASARKIVLEMKLMDAAGDTKGAVDLARSKISGISERERADVLLAAAEILLLKDASASQSILEPLMHRPDAAGIAALRLLGKQQLRFPGQGPMDSAKLIKALSKHPMATVTDKLMEADLMIAVDPGSKIQVIDTLKSAFANPKLSGELEFARWLNRRQANEEAIDFIGRERALANPEWLLVYLDAHAALDRWGDVFTLLDAETVVGLSDSIRLMFLARAAEKSGEIEEADTAWREMHRNLAYEKPEVVSFIANYTVQIGNSEQAFKAFSILSKNQEFAMQGYLGMIHTWQRNRPTIDLVKVYEEFSGAYPGIGEVRLDLAYLQLLTKTNAQEAAAVALEMHRKEPMSLATLSAAALGCLSNGFPEQGATLYEGKTVDWQNAPNPWKAVRVAVLRATGKAAEASPLAATIDLDQLRPEERELLESDASGSSGPLNP